MRADNKQINWSGCVPIKLYLNFTKTDDLPKFAPMAIIDLLVHALRKSTSALEHLNKSWLYHLPNMFKDLDLIPSIPLSPPKVYPVITFC